MLGPACMAVGDRTHCAAKKKMGAVMGGVLRFLFRVILFGVFVGALFSTYLMSLSVDPVERSGRQMSKVWADYPFTSHYVEVNGSSMHYIDEGNADGPVFLFLHGNPTSSYLWRDVVPVVAASGARAIAVDLIGFGASDRPDIGYRFAEHSVYLDGFIDALELENITLVIHDWGSGLGFDYAHRNPDNIRGIAFMEAIVRMGDMAALPESAQTIFTLFRTPVAGEFMVQPMNMFIEQALPGSVVRTLTEDEMNAYREPFPTWGSRLPVLVWPREIPFGGTPIDVAHRVNSYADWLPESEFPKLLLKFEPGAILRGDVIEEIESTWQNLTSVHIGEGLHFVQEDHGEAIGQAIVEWSNGFAVAEETIDVPQSVAVPVPNGDDASLEIEGATTADGETAPGDGEGAVEINIPEPQL